MALVPTSWRADPIPTRTRTALKLVALVPTSQRADPIPTRTRTALKLVALVPTSWRADPIPNYWPMPTSINMTDRPRGGRIGKLNPDRTRVLTQ